MSTVSNEHVEESISSYQARDPELYAELQKKLIPPIEERGLFPEGLMATVAAGTPADRSIVTPVNKLLTETIVRPQARPVLVIRDNKATTEFLGPDSQVWRDRILAAQTVLDRVIPAIGRVELSNNPDFSWVGTGWLVAPDIIVTNRHVAREFGRQGAQGFTFRSGLNGLPMTSQIDFLEEDQRLTSLEYAINSILWIAASDEPDVAFLRVTRRAGDRPLAVPIPLAETLTDVDFIATIGYPARDPRVPDQDLVRQIFGDVYDKKRLAPGQLLEIGEDELEHDCSTLGGNSGSALINLKNGEAVGLHFSGLFLEANFAVPAPKIKELLHRVQSGELPGSKTIPPTAPPPPIQTVVQSNNIVIQSGTPGSYTFQLQIPIEITVKLGGSVDGMDPMTVSSAGISAENRFENALRLAREATANNPDVIAVRPGYRFKRGWITDERVVVVEVKEKLPVADLQKAGKPVLPPQLLEIGVDVRTAALADQLEHLGIDVSALELRARPGQYREPPQLSLVRVKERMKAIFHVSPDSGFPNLKAFFGRIKQSLTATMYEWEPNHISDALAAAMTKEGATLRMVTQRAGTQAAVNDMKARIGDKFQQAWASVGAGKLFPSAYHIKVASRDGEEVWLSSGNWKDSNQADIDPAGEQSKSMTPLRQHNREWHAIIENAKLAQLFQHYIEYDFQEARRVPVDEAMAFTFPDIFVPEAVFFEETERTIKAHYFDPLVVDRVLEIQPLLTPDRNSRGTRLFLSHAMSMIKKATRKIYLENQSFNLLAENADEFEEFFTLLKNKQQAGLDVRIIFRDSREFGAANGVSQQKLLERLKAFGFDTGFIRVQRRCHTKGVIVDSTEVMLGSHNLTNEGSLFNRDASLLVRDAEVAAYFEQIFLFDWEVLSVQETDELVGGIRIANPGEPTPLGFRRTSISELLGES
ncbi:phospholipase D-like domain-containing protein [Larkinella terrae]|uniref:phospholipase D n=1 Tax=Larkinella terrae TaxID=2025311 RepID=A0A7K0EH56_9BACT|nr:phospholipase D-like domain-containing protein [Larkinella terrae]MRS60798.1 trypsin-like serine protease [Larkinella terrae]